MGALEDEPPNVDNADHRSVAEPSTVLLGLVGSTVHGLTVDDADDRDEMGICIEPPEYVVGLRRFAQWVYRTQPEGARSGPGDTDRTVYSLRKWCRLALNGNPTVMLLLHVPEEQCSILEPPGRELRANKEWFWSRRAGRAYLGYMARQRDRMTGARGQMRVNRPELIERYGFDTKYAGHVLRLGYQGIEFLQTGSLTLPMRDPERSHILDVRNGHVSFREVLDEANELQQRLEALIETAPLPEYANHDAVNAFLADTYRAWWDGAYSATTR
ncbi:MAG TPA: nucleotidyltransferase domain-containing protein [Gaiellaceae bacterium]|nr:nucleotidyltransferase domain-containing protein [Gaiellaceae bacterium]